MTTASSEKLLYLLKSRGARTAAEAGAALGMSAAGAQQHFARLAEDGLVEPDDVKHGRGRPRRYWKLTDKGHGRFPDRHSDLTLSLMEATRAVFGEAGLDELIRHREEAMRAHYAERLGDRETLEDRIRALAEARAEEGYMARVEPDEDGKGYILIEDHCPVCAAAQFCQGLCRSELAIFQEILAPSATVARTDYLLEGGRRCAYRITPA